MKHALLLLVLAGCDLLKPRVGDETVDASGPSIDAARDAAPNAPRFVLPAGAEVPGVATNAELLSQIKIFDGLNDNALAMAGGVVTRSTGKAAGATVMYWSFGSAAMADNYIVSAPVYMLANDDGAGNLTPRNDHAWLVDSIPGDARYSALRRIVYVPVTVMYAGELITSIDALNEAIELGLVGEPKPAGTWRNMPIVPPGTKLELGGSAAPMEATKVYGRGHVLDALPMGYVQPLSSGRIPMGQEARLLTGVATGTPPVLSTQLDPTPVFQYGIPAAPPTTTFNYSPVVTELDVRLANGVEPSAINGDAQLFKRSTTGAVTGYYTDAVASYIVTTVISNKQIQFAEGAP